MNEEKNNIDSELTSDEINEEMIDGTAGETNEEFVDGAADEINEEFVDGAADEINEEFADGAADEINEEWNDEVTDDTTEGYTDETITDGEIADEYEEEGAFADENDAEYVPESDTDSEEEEDKEKRSAIVINPKVVKLACLILFSGIILVFASIAWFTMNREVGTNGMSMTTTDLPFEIGTYGTSGTRYEGLLYEKKPEYLSGSTETIDGKVYYRTDTSNDSIKLRYSTGDSEIGPGGNGELSLYVIPKSDSTQKLKVTLDVTAFTEIEKKDSEGNPIYKCDTNNIVIRDSLGNPIIDTNIYEISSASLLKTNIMASDASMTEADALAKANACIDAASYIRGHIMFFGVQGTAFNDIESDSGSSSGTSDNKYFYATPYIDRTITVNVPANSEGDAVPVPIFWMWPNTLGQILLDGAQNMRSGYPLVRDGNTSEKAKMVQYLKNNKTIVFNDTTGISDAIITTNPTSTNFENMSKQYNVADFAIGTHIRYFLIEVKVEPYTETSE
ncbi:hypothetical protein SAMN04487934_10537 [Eubacterium ruminantium]|nr:hypothetical protein SAMN04487934_10537 [Eubacterium ruminantium]